MRIRIGRIALISIAIEALAIVILVLLVAFFGPKESSAAQNYAERVGYWVGPIAGFILCFVGSYLVARGLSSSHILNGLILGFFVGAIDVSLLVLSDAAFQTVFVVSNVGRVIAAVLGAWLASRPRSRKVTV